MRKMIEKSKSKTNCKQNSLEGIELGNFKLDYSSLMDNPSGKTETSDLKGSMSPNIEYMGHSLRKVQEITVLSQMLWSNKKISGKITRDVIKIMNQVYRKNFLFCNGKSWRCPLGGLFYLLGHRYNDPKRQKEIAHTLHTTEVSIRIYYKQWLRDFPELFQDITEKISKRDPGRHDYYQST
jgi:hypothetical protein